MAKKKYQVNLIVHSWDGLPLGCKNGKQPVHESMEHGRVLIKLKWMGTKAGLGLRFGRSLKQAMTTKKIMESGCAINWEEEFECVCSLTMTKKDTFLPWDIELLVMQSGRKPCVLGTAILNVAEFACATQEYVEHTEKVQISTVGNVEAQLSVLVITIKLRQLAAYESVNLERFPLPSLPCLSGPLMYDQETHAEMKGKNMKRSMSVIQQKISCAAIVCNDGNPSPTMEQSSGYVTESSDTQSVDDFEQDARFGKERKGLQSYGSLTMTNLVLERVCPYSVESIHAEELWPSRTENTSKVLDERSSFDFYHSSKCSEGMTCGFLPWKKRKMTFWHFRARSEPLLNKASEDGGDDIDHHRRLTGDPTQPLNKNLASDNGSPPLSPMLFQCFDFGEENFSVGKWENKEIVSRDGHVKLKTDVFFASIDQRHERVAGESACTVLVAVIADWLHRNPNCMPIRAEFDTLIREGSAEWRKLYDVEEFKTSFPDGHFDLDTVLQAKVRPISVIQDQTFVGFFQPEGIGDTYDFLHGVNTFEDIWDQMEATACGASANGSINPAVCIVSWNDHFFVLKLDKEAYYIIDTLGERLYEDCTQAYILRFGEVTSLCHMPEAGVGDEKDEKKDTSGSFRKDDKKATSATPVSSTSLAMSPSVSLSSSSSSSSSSCSQSPLPSALSWTSTSRLPTPSPSPSPSPSPPPPPLSLISWSPSRPLPSEVSDWQEDASTVWKHEAPAVYRGKDACKEFVKAFFAALPLRELRTDIQKGLLKDTALHTRLQIEFTFTSITEA